VADVVFNEADPCIAIVLREVTCGGVSGTCTECGRPMHRWSLAKAIESAQRHVDAHTPAG
jgi:hypothetical protein